MKHLKYLRYVLIHKWFVLCACWRRGLYWQGIVHDWSKFLPSEWLPYAEYFYGFKPSPSLREYAKREDFPVPDEQEVRREFDEAWLIHQHRSPHHWQHWILREDSGLTKLIAMPRRYVLEMLSDWDGAGRAITGKSGGTTEWYANNRHKIRLHPDTQFIVDRELGYQSVIQAGPVSNG